MKTLATQLSHDEAIELVRAFEDELGVKASVFNYEQLPPSKPNAMFEYPREGFAVEWKQAASDQQKLDAVFSDALVNARIAQAQDTVAQTLTDRDREALVEGVTRSIADPQQLELHSEYLQKLKIDSQESLSDDAMKRLLKDGPAALEPKELVSVSLSTELMKKVRLALEDDLSPSMFWASVVDFADADAKAAAALHAEMQLAKFHGEICLDAASDLDDDDNSDQRQSWTAKRRQSHRSKDAQAGPQLLEQMQEIAERILHRAPLDGELRRAPIELSLQAPDLAI